MRSVIIQFWTKDEEPLPEASAYGLADFFSGVEDGQIQILDLSVQGCKPVPLPWPDDGEG